MGCVNKPKDIKSLVKPGEQLENKKIYFSFEHFKPESIEITKIHYNSFFNNQNSAKKSANEFIKCLKTISNLDVIQFNTPEMKKQLHYNEFDDNEIIDRIEIILRDGYQFPQAKIDSFERTYLEISFNDGRRIIATRIHNNIIDILFLDNNHLICENSSRNIAKKLKFKIPSVYQSSIDSLSELEISKMDLMEMLIKDVEEGKITDLRDFVENYKELCALI